MWQQWKWSIGTSLTFLLLNFLGIYYLQNIDFWSKDYLESGVDSFFCEHSYMNDFIRQPINTYSNVFFLFFGIRMLTYPKATDSTNLLQEQKVYQHIFAWGSIFLCLCSTFFHASLICPAQQLDMAGVNVLMLLPLFYNFHRIHNLKFHKSTAQSTTNATVLYLLSFLVCSTIISLLKWQLNAIMVLAVVTGLNVMTTLYLEYKFPKRTNKFYLWTCIILLTSASSLYIADMKKVFCDEYGFFQPHAIWHISAAFSGYALFLYFQSEKVNRPNVDRH